MDRRSRGLVALALLIAVAGCGNDAEEGGATGSTLASRWIDADGNGTLEPGAGEPLRDRTELAPASEPRRVVATFAQVTDAHVRDEESPARLPALDRFGGLFESTFRPQEALTTQVLEATVRAVNEVGPDAVVITGDLIDSSQRNELDQALSVLNGGRVEPDSGEPGYDGVQSAGIADPFFYRPDVDPPQHRGILRQAQRPFASPGLEAPWYPVAGNHDLLVQGVVAATPETNAAATGGRMLIELDPDFAAAAATGVPDPRSIDRLLARGIPGRTVPTPPDPSRRASHPRETIATLRQASSAGGSGPLLDYGFDIGPRVLGIVLDSARREHGSGGIVRPQQVAWLRRQLEQAGSRWVVVFSHQPLSSSSGGERALTVLDRHPRVLAAVAGHTHRNSIEARRSPAGGYWLVTTASLADFPQQARAFRVVETAEGIALETWMLDHAPSPLAAVSRELAFLDMQGGSPKDFAGGRLDRNVRLHR